MSDQYQVLVPASWSAIALGVVVVVALVAMSAAHEETLLAAPHGYYMGDPMPDDSRWQTGPLGGITVHTRWSGASAFVSVYGSVSTGICAIVDARGVWGGQPQRDFNSRLARLTNQYGPPDKQYLTRAEWSPVEHGIAKVELRSGYADHGAVVWTKYESPQFDQCNHWQVAIP